MCGIAGIVPGKLRTEADYGKIVEKMITTLKHRGPDDSGVLAYDGCVLGQARLSIVDLTGGRQPMRSSLTGGVAITFNGEIYGYKEIKNTVKGYEYKTESDTELIIALYHKLGTKLVKKLPGIFSFALWDDSTQTLFCARDRFGEKPFYYAVGTNGEFIFASEIKAITAAGLVRPQISKHAAANYLRHLYIDPRETAFTNIFTLPPAHCLTFRDGAVSVGRYWEMPVPSLKIGFKDACAEFERLLDQSVRRQMVADVPVGAFLSGGMDSSAIVSLAAKYKPGLKTISFGFGNVSELPYARAVAERYNTEHVEIVETDFDIAALMLEMHNIYDEPFADSSNIPTYLISRAAGKHLKVVLSGDGGDEMMAGYSFWYGPLYRMQKALRESVIKRYFYLLAAKLKSVAGMPSSQQFNDRLNIYRMCRNFGNISAAHGSQNSYFSDAEITSLFGGEKSFGASVPSGHAAAGFNGTVDDAMRMDISDYMPGDILVKTDRASMACGLELRAPFLDVELASFCMSLPYGLKMDERGDKLLMRSCFADKLPETVLGRPKQGFGAPVGEWLQLKKVEQLKKEYLLDKNNKIYSLLPYGETVRLASRNDYRCWALLNLSLWLQTRNYDYTV